MPTRRGVSTRGASRRTGFSRETDLTRRVDLRPQRKTFLIVTNGERTEVDYFNALRREPWITAGKVLVRFEAGEPAAVVRYAAALRAQDDYDEAWAVCDLDEYDGTRALKDAASGECESSYLTRHCRATGRASG